MWMNEHNNSQPLVYKNIILTMPVLRNVILNSMSIIREQMSMVLLMWFRTDVDQSLIFVFLHVFSLQTMFQNFQIVQDI